MIHGLSILCPVDFSQGSRGALSFGASIAEHFGARLIVMTVSDPLLAEVAEMRMSTDALAVNVEQELSQFVRTTFARLKTGVKPACITAVGKPYAEILRVGREESCDLIVMSSHGLTGLRKLFFGATTERVLRETTIPVLVTHATDQGPRDLGELKRTGRPVLVPVDLLPHGSRHVKVGAAVADALSLPLLLTHVVEPLRFPVPLDVSLPALDGERRSRAEKQLSDLAASIPHAVKRECLVVNGDPAEEVAKIARDRHASLVVMGLQASTVTGPRMGSVTYRVLCLSPTVVLALPPEAPDA